MRKGRKLLGNRLPDKKRKSGIFDTEYLVHLRGSFRSNQRTDLGDLPDTLKIIFSAIERAKVGTKRYKLNFLNGFLVAKSVKEWQTRVY